MSQTTAGATVLAFGAQIPDTFGSLSLAKAGQPGGAVANAIGSQVINVSLGVGAPFLCYNLFYKQSVHAGDDDGMRQLVTCLSVVILTFWVVMFPLLRWIQGTSHISESRLSRSGGLLLGFISVIMYCTFVFLQEEDTL
jgi:Ca2+/Na+ antiporter